MTPIYLVDRMQVNGKTWDFDSGGFQFFPVDLHFAETSIRVDGRAIQPKLDSMGHVEKIWYTILVPVKGAPFKKFVHSFKTGSTWFSGDEIYIADNKRSKNLFQFYRLDELFPTIKQFHASKATQFIS